MNAASERNNQIMEIKKHYIKLLEYNDWANQRALDSILKTELIDQRAIRLFSHIIASQKIWLSRVANKGDNPVSPWEEYSLDICGLLSKQIHEDWIKFVEENSEEKLLSQINYKNSQGNVFKNKTVDILTHVINHSTYHRGQIASIVKASGGIPAISDYIFYKRE